MLHRLIILHLLAVTGLCVAQTAPSATPLKSPSPVAPPTLRVGTSSVVAPYSITNDDGKIVSGSNLDLANLIASKLNTKAVIVVVSRNRVEIDLKKGEFDLVCRMRREWLKSPDDFVWSGALFEKQDLIVGHVGTAPITSLEDLRGQTLGTVTGYLYPKLTEAFAHGEIKRDDALNEEGTLRKLVLKRTQYGVIDANIYAYYLKANKLAAAFNSATFLLEKHMAECAISKQSHFSAEQFAKAFAAIKEQKLIEPMLQKYR